MAWSETNGTKVLSNIIPTNPSDTYPTHLDKFGRGGYKAVTSIAERDAIPDDRLTLGCEVRVTEADGTSTLYYLSSLNPKTWTEAIGGVDEEAVTGIIGGLKGQANGLASLDGTGKVVESQSRAMILQGSFQDSVTFLNEIGDPYEGRTDAIYVDVNDSKMYTFVNGEYTRDMAHWDDSMLEILFRKGNKSAYRAANYPGVLYFAKDTGEIILDGVNYGSATLETEVKAGSKNAVTGGGIYNAINNAISKALGETIIGSSLGLITGSNGTYKVTLLDQNGNQISETGWIIGDQSGVADLSGLSVSRVGNKDIQIKTGQKAVCRFNYDVLDSAGESLGTKGSAVATITTPTGETIEMEPVQLTAGQVANIDVTEYVEKFVGDTIEIRVIVSATTSKGEQTTELFYTAKLINLAITSDYQLNTVTKIGNDVTIPFTITGILGLKTLRAYLDGAEVAAQEIQGQSSSSSIKVPTAGLSHGTHNIQLRADYKVLDSYGNVTSTVYSNIIYLDVVVVEEGNNTPVFACRFDYEEGDNLIVDTPALQAVQYDVFNLQYFVYDTNSSREAEFVSEGSSVGSNSFSDAALSIKYRYTSSGTKVCYFECGDVVYDFLVNVKASNYIIDEPTASLTLYLDALGKSNKSSSRDSWNYNNVTSTFENFNWTGDGWTGESLKLFNGSKVTVHHQPFKAPANATGALAFTIRFKVSNVTNPDEVIIDCTDKYGYGLTVTAQEAKLTTSTNSVSTKFATDEAYTVGFVSFPTAGENSSEYGKNNTNMCYIYVDGIISGGITKTAANEIYQIDPADIVMQAKGCELEVYSMRAYNTELTDDQMFSCHMIDLVSSEKIASEYEQNDVLDLNGEVTIAKVKGKIPYIVITGASATEGLSQFEYAAVQNNKDDKYDVESLLYVDDKDPNFNFYAVMNPTISKKNKPQIRLQGTSSMGYPRKNYRIYFNSGYLYLGCDANGNGGELLAKSVYQLSPTSAPVKCFCFKADFAESSSSHNTGTTGLVEEVFRNAGDLTPPQEHVDESEYPYEVRTTVEGKPCLIFYRSSTAETPKFAGKFNFNNDKSTEDVFGFLDIPGYHDNEDYAAEMEAAALKSLIFPEGFEQCSYDDDGEEVIVTKQDLIDMIGSNPTECWEFKNNTTRMGNFLEADFDKIDSDSSKGEYYWYTSWEARFPDEDGLNAAFEAGVKPYYLVKLAEWVVSTNTDQATGNPLSAPVTYGDKQYTNDTAEYRLAKFRNELGYYFDVNYLCSYYTITDCLAAADQRVKNMMWAFWYDPAVENHEIMGKMRCFPIFYDNDTILGLDNTGKIAINWDADENTKNGDSYAFAGHDMTVWVNLRAVCADYLESAYARLRNNNMTNQTILKWYNTNQSDMYAERIYNKDSLWKYIIPTNIGVPVLEGGVVKQTKYSVLAQMQGSRRAHRSWFVNNRMDTFDAKYKSGDYQASEITWKGAIEVEADENIGLTATVSRDQYLSVVEATDYKAHQLIKPGETFEFALSDGKGTAQGDVFHLYGIKWLKELDMSNWGGYEYIYFVGNMPTLEKLTIGGHRGAAPNVADIVIGNSAPSLKYIDLTNLPITNIDLSGCIYLETIIADDSKLVSVALANGCNVQYMSLPESFNNLQLVGLPKLTESGINLVKSDNLLRLRVENCDKLNGISLLDNILSTGTSGLRYVRITGLDLAGNGQDLMRYKAAGLEGMDSNGNAVTGKCKLVGKYRLTTLLDENVYNELQAYFDELVISQPSYTEVTFDYSITDPKKLTNLDNNTSGASYAPSGYINRILDKRHAFLVKSQEEAGTFAAMQLDDNDNNYYIDGTNAALDGSEGDYCMYEPHYWYKGVNNHKGRKLHAFFSDLESVPTAAKHKKINASECEVMTGQSVSTSNANTSESDILVANNSYNTYVFTLPENHNYKQYRVNGVPASSSIGAVIVDAQGNIVDRLYAASTNGMFENSYLFNALPEKAHKIYWTVAPSNNHTYAALLTESADIEAIEPDWVEHKECFIGKVISVLENDEMRAVVPSNATTRYGSDGSGQTVRNLCNYISNRGTGYTTFDYEAYKDILMLSYIKYGTTALHVSGVGIGLKQDGTTSTSLGRCFPGGVNITNYGIKDTKTDGSTFNSYYIDSSQGIDQFVYPQMATLMGYYHMLGHNTTCSVNDIVDKANSVYNNVRTGRSGVKIYSTTAVKYSRYIQGGRYLDLFTTQDSSTASTTTGFCVRETKTSGTGSGYLELSYSTAYSVSVPASIEVTSNLNVTASIATSATKAVQRILIAPTVINKFETSSEYNNAI